ncbi:hypothetical protein CLF_100987 [Clonorchis sinensis]|uniref:Uncharacterized protein n=1 Tax=Clonorchis sinensis TaxID=79923 RepID=G7Y4R5_CLOSI|nr:hypothetical protein CLF_100987 [Clonorchis sinensis]
MHTKANVKQLVTRDSTRIPLYCSHSGAEKPIPRKIGQKFAKLPVRHQTEILLVESLDPTANHDPVLAECRLPVAHPEGAVLFRSSRQFTLALIVTRMVNAVYEYFKSSSSVRFHYDAYYPWSINSVNSSPISVP